MQHCVTAERAPELGARVELFGAQQGVVPRELAPQQRITAREAVGFAKAPQYNITYNPRIDSGYVRE